MAGRAGRIDTGHEQQLDADKAFALAGNAAALGDVEREAPGIEALRLGLLGGGKQFAHGVEQAGVGGQVGAGGTADGFLIDLDQALDAAKACLYPATAGLFGGVLQAVFFGLRTLLGMAQVLAHQLQQRLADQAGFARAGNTGYGSEATQGELGAEVDEVVAGDAFQL
ncbi:hypothetical protein D3C81_983550 [compost metagenome]